MADQDIIFKMKALGQTGFEEMAAFHQDLIKVNLVEGGRK